jgi:hypothetical protein
MRKRERERERKKTKDATRGHLVRDTHMRYIDLRTFQVTRSITRMNPRERAARKWRGI